MAKDDRDDRSDWVTKCINKIAIESATNGTKRKHSGQTTDRKFKLPLKVNSQRHKGIYL